MPPSRMNQYQFGYLKLPRLETLASFRLDSLAVIVALVPHSSVAEENNLPHDREMLETDIAGTDYSCPT